jgi:hypothetical protein
MFLGQFYILGYNTSIIEATCSSEMSVGLQRTTRRYIPEDRILPNHRFKCKNCLLLKPIILLKYYENYQNDTESCKCAVSRLLCLASCKGALFVRRGYVRLGPLCKCLCVCVCVCANNFNNIVACTDPLLGSDREKGNETTSATRQQIFNKQQLNYNRGTVFSKRPVPKGSKQNNWRNELGVEC